MKQFKFILKGTIILIFYIMSPFCPWNNGLEVEIMDRLATLLQKIPFLLNIKLYIISGILYFIYNVLATLGFMSLSNSKNNLKWKELLSEIVISITAYYSVKHFLKGYIIYFIIIFSIIYGLIHYKRNKEIYKNLLKKRKMEEK